MLNPNIVYCLYRPTQGVVMKLLVSVCLLAVLSGCGTYGEPLLLSAMFDSQDPCQSRNRGADYQKPNWCGASANRAYIYNRQAYPVGYVQR